MEILINYKSGEQEKFFGVTNAEIKNHAYRMYFDGDTTIIPMSRIEIIHEYE